MSFGRDADTDRAATRDVLLGLRPQTDGDTNWLGHAIGTGAAQIDEMLLTGVTRDQMATARGGVEQHLRHLRGSHGLPIVEAGTILMFDRVTLGALAESNEGSFIETRDGGRTEDFAPRRLQNNLEWVRQVGQPSIV